jgi:hypothetical protein
MYKEKLMNAYNSKINEKSKHNEKNGPIPFSER